MFVSEVLAGMRLKLADLCLRGARRFTPRPLFDTCAGVYNRSICRLKLDPAEYRKLIKAWSARGPGEPVEVSFRNLRFPLWIRPGTPDATEVIHSVVREAYKAYAPRADVRVIVDAGAYIGDTTAWYLSRYPLARVVALEPNPANFEMLVRNVRPYGNRAIALPNALWPTDGTVEMTFDVGETAGRAALNRDGGVPVTAVSPRTLMRSLNAKRIDIFKMDIEGAELILFEDARSEEWLACTRHLVMEIHAPDPLPAVRRLLSSGRFRYSRYKELHVFRAEF